MTPDGTGYGNTSRFGNGLKYGYGNGYGDGHGDGYGYGNGYGDGGGDGYGYGDGYSDVVGSSGGTLILKRPIITDDILQSISEYQLLIKE